MRYMGGKTRIAKQIAAEIDKVRKPGQLVWDAFCGGLSVSVALRIKGPVLSSDKNLALISMYQAIASGWVPPDFVSESEYHAAKTLPDTDPFKAFAGFCAAYGGRYFEGYARGENRNWAGEGKRSLLRDVPNGNYECIDFLSVLPKRQDFILYCDIPYLGTKQYQRLGTFDHNDFINKTELWSKYVHVFVSEHDFPIGVCVWEKAQGRTVGRATKSNKQAVERLYHIPKQT